MSDAKKILPRVLVVDDSRMVRAIIIKQIRGNFDVREEVDGEAGWSALLIDPSIQVVITDQSMPKLDGFQLIERIRASKIARIRDIPLIMISGDEDEAARQRAKDLGASDFIAKGIGTAELLSRLDVLIKLSRTSQALEEVRTQTVVDEHSGLLSRAYLLRQGEQAVARSRRHGNEITTLVIGFDHLEKVKTRFGDAVHEQLLQHFTDMLMRSIRREDSLARWSEDVVAVLSPTATLRESNSFALRLRTAVDAASVECQGHHLHLTVSIGIANNHADKVDTAEAILEVAERRMLKAVAQGGNQVIGTGDQPLTPKAATIEAVDMTIDRAIAFIEAGEGERVRPHLPTLVHRLQPLLRMLEADKAAAKHQSPDDVGVSGMAVPSANDNRI